MPPARLLALALSLSLSLPSCAADEPLPWPVPAPSATSEYVAWSTWTDGARACMTGALLEADDFLADAAALLEIDPPATRIRYVHTPPRLVDADTWACADDVLGCFPGWQPPVVWGHDPLNYHELAHALAVPALGSPHPLLEEGLAEWLSSSATTERVLDDFPTRLEEGFLFTPYEADYRRSMHFVGSLVAHHGVDKYKRLRAWLPFDADFAALATTYEDIYGEPLATALARMQERPIESPLQRCPGAALAWPDPTEPLTAALAGRCGDRHYTAVEGDDGELLVTTSWVVEISTAGTYALRVRGPTEDLPPHTTLVRLATCPGHEHATLVATPTEDDAEALPAARVQLIAWYPPTVDPAIGWNIELERLD